MPIIIKSDEEIAIIREAGIMVAQGLGMRKEEVRPGLVLRELDDIVQRAFAGRGVAPACLG